MRRTGLALLLCLVTTTAAAACGGEPDAERPGERLQVAAAFYPLEFVAERVGGDAAVVEGLTEPGAEPHDLELTPRQAARLGESDLVLHLSGFQPAVDDAIAQQASDAALDLVSTGHAGHVADEEQPDPHVWLDPVRYAGIADAVAARMGELAPDRADGFTGRARELRRELEVLDAELRSGLSDCRRKQIVTSHDAFGHLARAYGLEQVPITGLSPEQEASPARLAEVEAYAEQHGVTTVFFEDLVSPAVAQSLADEVGARAVQLSPLEGPPDSGDYLTEMRRTLSVLRTALSCR